MLRRLLTFFALLTGLAASAVPLHARIVNAETCVAAACEIVVKADKRQQRAAMAPLPPVVHAALASNSMLLQSQFAAVSVLIGIDRARE